MAKKNKNNATSTEPSDTTQTPKDVSLGPACGVFFILAGVVFAVGMAAAAFLLFGKQDEMAVQALKTQLIPWVEESELSAVDQEKIIEKLSELSAKIEQGEVTDRQLARIRTRVTQNPILQWAPIEQTVEFADTSSQFSAAEREQLKSIRDRLMQACIAYQINMEDLGFLLQNIVTQESKSMRLVRKPDLSHADVVSFMQRAEQMLERRKIELDPNKRNQQVADVFNQMIDEAFDVDSKLQY